MPNLDNARAGATDICRKCQEPVYLVDPTNYRGLTGWHWVHEDTHSMWCKGQEAEPVNHVLDEDADQSMSISNYRQVRTPLAQLGYTQRCRYYEIVGIGQIKEITEGEYEYVTTKCVAPDHRGEVLRPFTGIIFKGKGYVVLPTEG